MLTEATSISRPRVVRLDGRNKRGEETKRKIMEAGRRLIFDANGQLRPRPPAAHTIAKESGVSVRSIFQHYGDVKRLADAIFEPEEVALKAGTLLLDRMGLKDVPIPKGTATDDEGLPVDEELREAVLLMRETKLRLVHKVYLMHLVEE